MEITNSSILPWGALHNDYLITKPSSFPSVSHYIYCSIINDTINYSTLDTNLMKQKVLKQYNSLKMTAATNLPDYDYYSFRLTIQEQSYLNSFYFFLKKDLKAIFNIIQSFKQNNKNIQIFYNEVEGKYLDDIIHKACERCIHKKILIEPNLDILLKVFPEKYSITDTGFLQQYTNKWTNHYYRIYQKNIKITSTLIQSAPLLSIEYTKDVQWIRDLRLPMILKTLDILTKEFMINTNNEQQMSSVISLMFDKCNSYQNTLKTHYVIDSPNMEFIGMYNSIIENNCYNKKMLNEAVIYAVWKHVSFLLITMYQYGKHIKHSYTTIFKLLSSEFNNVFTLEDIVDIIYNITENILLVYQFIYKENPVDSRGIVKIMINLLEVNEKVVKMNVFNITFIEQMELLIRHLFDNQSCLSKQVLSRMYYFS